MKVSEVRSEKMMNQYYLSYRQVLEKSSYSESWKKRLLFYFDKYIVPIPYKKFLRYLDNPGKFVDYMTKRQHVKITLMKSLYEMIIFLLKNVQKISSVKRLKKWNEFYIVISYMYNKYLDERKKESINCLYDDGITVDSLIQYRTKLQTLDPLRMLLNVYVLIPPARADYGSIRIYLNHDDLKKENSPNYILMDMKEKKGKICLRQYKTSGVYNDIVNDIPDGMMSDLIIVMEKYPKKKYLFERVDGTQYNVKRYDEFANRNFRRIHKKLTINAIRKLYATKFGDSMDEMSEKADELKHRLVTHVNYYVALDNSKLYNKLIGKEDSEDSSDKE